ncbi:MAG: hypothetical protein ACLFPL_02160 [Candidatus Nanoarchaeia archaeon]
MRNKLSKLVIIFEIWGIEEPESEFVRKLLSKNNYRLIQEKDPGEWFIQYEIS